MDSRSDAEPDLLGPLPDYLRQATGDIASVAAASGAGLWVVCDYAAGRKVLADSRFSRSEIIKPDSPKVNGPEPAQHSIMSMDGDDHARLRRLVAGSFTARRVPEMAPLLGQRVEGIFDQMA